MPRLAVERVVFPTLYRSVVVLPLMTFWMVVVMAVLPRVAEDTFAEGTLPSSS